MDRIAIFLQSKAGIAALVTRPFWRIGD